MNWRKSLNTPRIWILQHGADQRGSIEPKGKRWLNRDTGELFDTKAEVMLDVEQRTIATTCADCGVDRRKYHCPKANSHPCEAGCQMNPTGDPQNDCGDCLIA